MYYACVRAFVCVGRVGGRGMGGGGSLSTQIYSNCDTITIITK